MKRENNTKFDVTILILNNINRILQKIKQKTYIEKKKET